jgi:hypothetical protein
MLRPRIQAAARASVFDALAALCPLGFAAFAFVLVFAGSYGGGRRRLSPMDRKAARQQGARGAVERTVRQDVMTYAVAGLIAALLTGAARLQADLFHTRGPFAIVIAATAGRAVMVLPQMHHFMGEGGEHVRGGAVVEVTWIERDLVSEHAVRAAEAVAGEVAIRAVAALERDQAIWQFTVEEFPVQKVIRLLKPGVGFFGGTQRRVFADSDGHWDAHSTFRPVAAAMGLEFGGKTAGSASPIPRGFLCRQFLCIAERLRYKAKVE